MTSERAEVAGRIRATVGDLDACNGFHHLWRAVTGETAPEMDREARGRLFLMLADLIDPTTRPIDAGLGSIKCPLCGHITSETTAREDLPGNCHTYVGHRPRFCGHCGVRFYWGGEKGPMEEIATEEAEDA